MRSGQQGAPSWVNKQTKNPGEEEERELSVESGMEKLSQGR